MDLYIGYKEVDKLLPKYPALKALLLSYQIDLEQIYYGEPAPGLQEEEVLYALYFARELTDMPRSAPNPGDKMTNIITAKDKIMQDEYPKGLVEAIKIIGPVVKKIAIALASLPPEERMIIELRHFEGKSWLDIEEIVHLTPTRLGQIRKEAVEKMLPVLRITPEQYKFCAERTR